MMFLNIVIQNSTIPIYRSMYEILSPYYKNYSGYVETFFVEYVTDLNSDYEISGDLIKIKGHESMVPGLILKTIESLGILKRMNKSYDYIIRSNVSTIINFNVIESLLVSSPKIHYFGGNVLNLNWLDIPFGIVDEKYFGTHFAQGTLIGMSSQLADILLDNKEKLHFDIVDDVAVGIFFAKYCPHIRCQSFNNNLLVVVSNKIYDVDLIINYNKKNLPVAWRNKSDNREIDLINMRSIVNVLNDSLLSL